MPAGAASNLMLIHAELKHEGVRAGSMYQLTEEKQVDRKGDKRTSDWSYNLAPGRAAAAG